MIAVSVRAIMGADRSPGQGTATLVQAVNDLFNVGHRYRPAIDAVCSSLFCSHRRTGMACSRNAFGARRAYLSPWMTFSNNL